MHVFVFALLSQNTPPRMPHADHSLCLFLDPWPALRSPASACLIAGPAPPRALVPPCTRPAASRCAAGHGRGHAHTRADDQALPPARPKTRLALQLVLGERSVLESAHYAWEDLRAALGAPRRDAEARHAHDTDDGEDEDECEAN